MLHSKIVFLHGLQENLVKLVFSAFMDQQNLIAISAKAPESEQIEALHDADFIMIYRANPSPAVLKSATKARLVQLLSAGYDGLNVQLLHELGIPCANNGGANSCAVADQTVLSILALYRRFIPVDHDVRSGIWNAGIDGLNTFELAGKRVGLVGMGSIGQQVARRVQAFDSKVCYFNRTPLPPELEAKLDVRFMALDDLFTTCDVISLHVPLNSQTHHMVNATRLALMKPNAIIINTSRGAVIDEKALIQALLNKRIAGAGLDVFENEPVEASNPLLSMSQVVTSPHSAGTTSDTWVRRGSFARQNFERIAKGDLPLCVIDVS